MWETAGGRTAFKFGDEPYAVQQVSEGYPRISPVEKINFPAPKQIRARNSEMVALR